MSVEREVQTWKESDKHILSVLHTLFSSVYWLIWHKCQRSYTIISVSNMCHSKNKCLARKITVWSDWFQNLFRTLLVSSLLVYVYMFICICLPLTSAYFRLCSFSLMCIIIGDWPNFITQYNTCKGCVQKDYWPVHSSDYTFSASCPVSLETLLVQGASLPPDPHHLEQQLYHPATTRRGTRKGGRHWSIECRCANSTHRNRESC